MQFIALQTSVQAEELEIYARKPRSGTLGGGSSSSMDDAPTVPCIGLQIVEGHESLATLVASFTSERGELVRFLNQYIVNHLMFFSISLSFKATGILFWSPGVGVPSKGTVQC